MYVSFNKIVFCFIPQLSVFPWYLLGTQLSKTVFEIHTFELVIFNYYIVFIKAVTQYIYALVVIPFMDWYTLVIY